MTKLYLHQRIVTDRGRGEVIFVSNHYVVVALLTERNERRKRPPFEFACELTDYYVADRDKAFNEEIDRLNNVDASHVFDNTNAFPLLSKYLISVGVV